MRCVAILFGGSESVVVGWLEDVDVKHNDPCHPMSVLLETCLMSMQARFQVGSVRFWLYGSLTLAFLITMPIQWRNYGGGDHAPPPHWPPI